MRKRDELVEGCMAKARPDAMTFVLLARDAAAPVAIRAWIAERVRLGKNRPHDEQIVGAEQIAKTMELERQRAEVWHYRLDDENERYACGAHRPGDAGGATTDASRVTCPACRSALEPPRYPHDCVACVFLGRYGPDDLYFCASLGHFTARFGDGDKYSTAPLSLAHLDDRLAEAKRRAEARGLLKP